MEKALVAIEHFQHSAGWVGLAATCAFIAWMAFYLMVAYHVVNDVTLRRDHPAAITFWVFATGTLALATFAAMHHGVLAGLVVGVAISVLSTFTHMRIWKP